MSPGARLPSPDAEEHIRSIPFDLIVTLLTCGLFNLVVQYRQMRAVNAMLGVERYRFLPWLLFCLLTCGLYHLYHEYKKSFDISRVSGDGQPTEAVVALLLTVFGLHIVADAIQQTHINRYFGDDRV
jgi:hypothetical protein